MSKIIIVPEKVIDIVRNIQKHGYEAYLVGGCVRDMLLEKQPNDWDICSNATPKQLFDVFEQCGYKYHTVGIEFGTVTAIVDNEEYEVTTYRSETEYTDGRHPDIVEFVNSIHEDLKRRDFTINAMAFDPISDKLIDDFGGVDDLSNGIIKAVGNPAERFNEDYVRILRALRFAIRYQFNIDRETSLCMHRQRGLLVNTSKERITAELEKMLTCGNPIFNHFVEYRDIIATILPEMLDCFDFWQSNKYHKHNVYEHLLAVTDLCNTTSFEIKLAALLHDVAKPKCFVLDNDGMGHFYNHPDVSADMFKVIGKESLRLTTEQYEKVYTLIKYHDNLVASTRASVKRMLNKIGEDNLKDWFILKQADLDDHVYPDGIPKWYMDIPKLNEIMSNILSENSCFSLKDLEINGNDIMKLLGIKPGKQIGIILNTLLEEVIDEKISNDYESLSKKASELYDDMIWK